MALLQQIKKLIVYLLYIVYVYVYIVEVSKLL